MAYKDSDELKTDERYPLGDYSFRIERTSVPGSTNDKIEAICTDKGGKNARKSIQVPSSTQLFGWYVEANETEASVYIKIKREGYSPLIEGTLIAVGGGMSGYYEVPEVSKREYTITENYAINMACYNNIVIGAMEYDPDAYSLFSASRDSYIWDKNKQEWRGSSGKATGTHPEYVTYDNKQVVYSALSSTWSGDSYDAFNLLPRSDVQATDVGSFTMIQRVAWSLVYSSSGQNELEDVLVARFAIDIEDAGGDGPGSDWIDPGDYDPNWEEGDPTHTLYVTVTGALSGRHNDPIEDPSYSYIPADKNTVKDYGCGGDGGHGGGGGAGASTVVIHKFATNQANSKEVTAIARRHGYGSGGGKGGKGGDGCILVYY